MKRTLERLFPVLFLPVFFLSCDSGGDKGASYSGTYTGLGTYSSDVSAETISSSMRLTVAHSEDEVTITGSYTIEGETTQMDAITGFVSSTGFFTPTGGGNRGGIYVPDCGQLSLTSNTWVFSAQNLRITQSVQFGICGELQFFANLKKQ